MNVWLAPTTLSSSDAAQHWRQWTCLRIKANIIRNSHTQTHIASFCLCQQHERTHFWLLVQQALKRERETRQRDRKRLEGQEVGGGWPWWLSLQVNLIYIINLWLYLTPYIFCTSSCMYVYVQLFWGCFFVIFYFEEQIIMIISFLMLWSWLRNLDISQKFRKPFYFHWEIVVCSFLWCLKTVDSLNSSSLSLVKNILIPWNKAPLMAPLYSP